MVDTVVMNMSDFFPSAIYKSCKDVQSSSGPAINVMCGPWGTECNGKHLLDNLGVKDPAPFQVNFNFFTDSQAKSLLTPVMNYTTYACHEKYPQGDDGTACSCTDCLMSCKPKPQPLPPTPFKLFGTNGLFVIMFLFWLLIGSMIGFIYLRKGFSAAESLTLSNHVVDDHDGEYILIL